MKQKKNNNSQINEETHCKIASHIRKETQNVLASQMNKETHKVLAQNQNMLAELGKLTAGSYYDHQEVRITEMNRVRDIVYRRFEELDLNEIQEKKPEEQKYLKKFQDRYLNEYIRILKEQGKIAGNEEAYLNRLMEVQKNAEKFEKMYKSLMMDYVENEIIFREFLEKIRGISAVLSANLLKEFGYCEGAEHISSLWKYCGMHVVEGEAPKRRKGQKLEFSARLRTMVWKIGDSFIKQRTPFYRDIYDVEKARQLKLMDNNSHKAEETHGLIASHKTTETQMFIANAPKSLLHADLRARRKMVKVFLAHYFLACKELKPYEKRNPSFSSEPREKSNPVKFSEPSKKSNPKGFSDNMPYAQAKLGHAHISNWRDAVAMQSQRKEVVEAWQK